MRRWLLFLPIFLLILTGSGRGERWYKLYDQAEDDINHQRYHSAIRKLEQAVAQKADSGPSVRGEGTKRMAYFPYFLMGKAYYHLGRYAEADRFFNREAGLNLPHRIATEIAVYRTYLRAIADDRKRVAEFSRIVEQAEASRARGAFVEAADRLRQARQHHPAEFDRRNLGRTVEELLNLERSRVEEKNRRDRETRFLALIREAAQREKQGRLREAAHLLVEADRLISGRSEVTALRKRIKDREDRYAELKQAALADQIEGKLPQALQALKQAGEVDPDRFNSDKLGSLAASLSRQVEIQENIRSRAKTAQPRRQDARIPKTRNQGATPPSRREGVHKVSEADSEAMRRAVVAAYHGVPQDALRMLQAVQSNSNTRGTRNAELQSCIGIAYARLSFLTVNPVDSERFREKATQHFRLALALDPMHKLNSRLVAPQIRDLFAASR